MWQQSSHFTSFSRHLTLPPISDAVDAGAGSRERSDVNKIFPLILRSGSLDQLILHPIHCIVISSDCCVIRSGSGAYSCVALSEGAGEEARQTAGNATILITESVTYLDKVSAQHPNAT